VHEAPELRLHGSSPPGRLLLEGAERADVALRLDDLLDALRPEGADQLVLEIRVAHVEAEALHGRAVEVAAETGPLERTPEVTLLGSVAETGQPDVAPPRPELDEEASDRLGAADRHHEDVLGGEIAALAFGERFEREPVADPLDEDHGSQRVGQCIHGRIVTVLGQYAEDVARGGYVLQLGEVPYLEAWELQRSLAGAVSQGAIPETVILLEHPPVITLGRRTDEAAELHLPNGASVEVVETDRGGKSTYHAPGQLVCYPILDLRRHGRDVKEYVRNLERALAQTIAPFGLAGEALEGLTGLWLTRPPRKIASIGVHVSRWITTHGYALNVDLDPAPFTDWITACGLEDATFTTIARELGRPVTVGEVRPHAVAALAAVFDLELEELPADDGAGLWPQPRHAGLAGRG
jgi:lipoyl(octanoyl) transferase